MRLQRTLLPTLVLAQLVIASRSYCNDAAKDDLKKLQGRWQVTKFIDASEEPAPPGEIKEMTLEFKGNTLIMSKSKDSVRAPVKFSIDPSKTPKWMNVEDGGPNRTSEAIYKIEGDELSFCVVAGSRNGKVPLRPTEFKGSAKGPYTLLVLKKIKE